jgi:hypothetical protein
MASSGVLRRVALVITDVSEELSASIISVTRISELETTLVVTSSLILVTLMMEALSYSEMSVLKRATRCNIPEDAILSAVSPLHALRHNSHSRDLAGSTVPTNDRKKTKRWSIW